MTEIVKAYNENHSDTDRQREFVVALMKERTDLSFIASSIRLGRFTEILGIKDVQLESLLANVEEHCFKQNRKINDFIKSVNDVCSVSNRMQVTVEDLPHKLQQMVNKANLVASEKEIKRKKADKGWAVMDSYIAQRQLEEFRNKGPLAVIEKLRLSKRQLVAVINACNQGQNWLKKQLAFESFARMALAAELANCHKRLYGDSNSSDEAQPI